ncbi:hypothetical protein O7621_26210 [Solwaraspora sp. WMMD937]|uniref:hypothetical protein n=1 Tax=Solwaraspora sp. WMMD937 TaxID=3016090 RepID=UPI00249BED15|nr:hypothetical protein [Solwaraspora sp. WMMD937]WFE21300.1 hypothetical protein O7621_26210 [Solwaraspora sp. WMMD937]
MGQRDQQDWARQRRQAIAAHAADQQRRRASEALQAADLLAEFVAAARRHGIAAQHLSAQPHHGRGRYRTGLHGWYLKSDRTLAVGTDGNLYLLTVPASLRSRLTGVRVSSMEPRLVIGAGGRDGESIPLATLLDRRLAAGPGQSG